MRKLALTVALAAAVVIPSSWNSRPAMAGGYHHHWRHHVWGDGDWEIIRWANGDCKIWHDDNGPPWGTDWVVLADGLRTYEEGWRKLVWLQSKRMCS